MQNEQMLRLAERLEKATGPDRELDLAIHRAIRHGPRTRHSDNPRNARRYTASIDAAMTLVPEGWDWLVNRGCAVVDRDGVDTMYWLESDMQSDGHGRAWGANPALALCAAALRSRTGDQSNG